jgi:hypothetical protein
MTTNHLDASEVDSYDYLIVGGGTAVSNHFVSSKAGVSMEHQVHSGCRRDGLPSTTTSQTNPAY